MTSACPNLGSNRHLLPGKQSPRSTQRSRQEQMKMRLQTGLTQLRMVLMSLGWAGMGSWDMARVWGDFRGSWTPIYALGTLTLSAIFFTSHKLTSQDQKIGSSTLGKWAGMCIQRCQLVKNSELSSPWGEGEPRKRNHWTKPVFKELSVMHSSLWASSSLEKSHLWVL